MCPDFRGWVTAKSRLDAEIDAHLRAGFPDSEIGVEAEGHDIFITLDGEEIMRADPESNEGEIELLMNDTSVLYQELIEPLSQYAGLWSALCDVREKPLRRSGGH